LVQRLLGVATEPLGIVLCLFLGGALLAWAGKRRTARAAFVLAVVFLWGAATPLVSDALSARIESITPALPPAARGDALVILGGALAGQRPPRTGPELVDSSDRILTAARLFKEGRAPMVVISGGSGPWGVSSVPESVEIAGLLVEWGSRSSHGAFRRPAGAARRPASSCRGAHEVVLVLGPACAVSPVSHRGLRRHARALDHLR
jgi:uncharacterized SAM-binding protein YcdF (DUF218 family)